MLFTHFKSAWRNLLRHPFSSSINIIGLAIGITCCIFISIYVWSELQADEFHEKKANLFRVNRIFLEESNRAGNSEPYPLGTALQNEYPEIKKMVRLGQDNVSIRAGQDSYFYEDKFYWADSALLNVFTFPLVKGNAATALKDPHSLVMTESMAKKYFKEEDPIGKEVEVKIYDGDRKFSFTVTGVVKDLPKNSTIQFEFLAPMHMALQVYPQFENSWSMSWVTTYVLADAPTIKEQEKQSAAFFEKYVGKGMTKMELEFQPMSRLHLYSGHVGKNLSDAITNVYLFTVIGVFIFLLACVNFVNLSTARAELRKKEVGVRKALGAYRKQLFTQFMVEALLTAAIVLVIAFGATSMLEPLASQYVEGTSIVFSAFVLPLVFLGTMILIGVFAGLYPAAFLSSFNPLEALKGKTEKLTTSVFSPRQVLVVFQFTISIALIAGTLIVNKQVGYMKSADLGMATDQLITIPVDDRELQKKMISIRDLAATAPGVTGAATTGESFPAAMNNTWDITWPGSSQEEDRRAISIVAIDENYFDLINAHFAEGRNLSREGGTDSSAFIINEAARAMMMVKEVTGLNVTIGGKPGTIIGVVKDIHHYSLHQKVEPTAYLLIPARNRACADNLVLKINAQSLPATIASLKAKWETLTQDRPFEYHFIDEEFARTYESEERFLILFEIFSGLAIVIACLGLMGLSSFVVNRRAKEIGIRKVLGASVSQILFMLTKGFSIPIVIAFLIAGPGVYYLMNGWLDKFAYKITIDVVLIVVSGMLAWLVAFSFIGLQSWKAARVNPVNTLKDE